MARQRRVNNGLRMHQIDVIQQKRGQPQSLRQRRAHHVQLVHIRRFFALGVSRRRIPHLHHYLAFIVRLRRVNFWA